MVEVLTNLIRTYIEPLLRFSGCYFDSDGKICPEGDPNSAFKFTNKKYTEDGLNGPPTFIPTLISTDHQYVVIKKNPEFEIFNPFVNNKHMTLVALAMKQKLVDFYFFDESDDDDDLVEHPVEENFKYEPISFYSTNEPNGDMTVVFTNNKDPENPVEIARATSDNPIKAIWYLCVITMMRNVRRVPDQYKNIDAAWKTIETTMANWDKLKKKLIQKETEPVINNLQFSDLEDFEIRTFQDSDYVQEEEIDDYLNGMFTINQDPTPLRKSLGYGESDFDNLNLTGGPSIILPGEEVDSWEFTLGDKVLM